MKPLFIGDRFNFGKYRDQPICKIMESDPSYIAWLAVRSPVRLQFIAKVRKLHATPGVGMKVHCQARRGIYTLVEIRGDKAVLTAKTIQREGYELIVPFSTLVRAGGINNWNSKY